MKKFTVLLCLFSLAVFAAAPKKFTNDVLQFGAGSNGAIKELIFNTGAGTNPSIRANSGDGSLLLRPNGVSLGDGTASDKNFTFDIGQGANNPKLFWDNTAGALSFTNGGTLVKKIGSGSGAGGSGGVNLLLNSSFEDPGTPILNWTASGGTLTQEAHTNGREGNLNFARFVSTLAGQYVESDVVTVSDDLGFGCMADVKYNQGSNAFTLKVLKEDLPGNPGTFIEVASGDFADLTSFLKAPTVTFPCEGGEVFKLRSESTAAGTIDLEDAYLGSNKGIIPAPLTVATVEARGNGGEVVGLGTLIPFTEQVDSSNVFSNGEFTVSKNNSFIEISGDLAFTSGVGRFVALYKNGTQYKLIGDFTSSSTHNFNYTSYQGEFSKEDVLSIRLASGSGTLLNNTTNHHLTINEFSSQTQEAFTPEQAEFRIAGQITGGQFALTSSAEASFQPIAQSLLAMTLEDGTAKIPCNGQAAAGLNCDSQGVSEKFGVVFNAPVSGKYKVCFTFDHQQNDTSSMSRTFWIVKRPLNDVGANLEVGTRTVHAFNNTNGYQIIDEYELCNVFEIPNVGEQRFEVRYTKDAGNGTVFFDSPGASTNRAAKFNVELLNNDVAVPRLLNQVSTSNRAGSIYDSCRINNDGSTATAEGSQCASWVSTLTKVSTGLVDLNFVSPYLENPVCVCSVFAPGSDRKCAIRAISSSVVRIRTSAASTNTANNEDFMLVCTGRR